jgi:hypothetical protein
VIEKKLAINIKNGKKTTLALLSSLCFAAPST